MKISLYDVFEYLDLKFFFVTKAKWWKEEGGKKNETKEKYREMNTL